MSVRGAYAGTGRRGAFLLVGGADRVGEESLAAAGLLDVAEAELTLRDGNVDALEIPVVPPATLGLAVDAVVGQKRRDVGVAAAVTRILVVEDRARVRGGADEG